MRGLTAIPAPSGAGEVLLAAVEGEAARIVRVDPRDGSEATKLDLGDFLGQRWGVRASYVIAAYSDMAKVRNPGCGEAPLIGLEAFIPLSAPIATVTMSSMSATAASKPAAGTWCGTRPEITSSGRSPHCPNDLWWRRGRSGRRRFRRKRTRSILPATMRTRCRRTTQRGSSVRQSPRRSGRRSSDRSEPRGHTVREKKSTLIVFGALPGTGKTTLARAVAEEHSATYLRIDTIEQALRSSGVLAGDDVGPAGYLIAYKVAESNLLMGRTVVADSVNPLAVTRDAWHQVAATTSSEIVEIEVVCSDIAEHRRRVETRSVDVPGLALPCWQDVVERDYEPWD